MLDSPELSGLFHQLEPFKPAPVHKWKPRENRSIDIRIDAKGIWHYQNSPIQRHKIVRLFSTVLTMESQQYYLVTPDIKYKIQVEEAPFLAVELILQHSGEPNQNVFFRTNMDEVIKLSKQNPLTVKLKKVTHEPVPYIHVRSGLQAKLTRAVFYELSEYLEPDSSNKTCQEMMAIRSDGCFFLYGVDG